MDIAELDQHLERSAGRRRWYAAVGDQRSLDVQNSVINRQLDQRLDLMAKRDGSKK